MRHFNGLLFMGSKISIRQRLILHTLLNNALVNMSGLQQGHGHCSAEQNKEVNEAIEHAANDIYCALTGKEITSTFKMPYPPDFNGENFSNKDIANYMNRNRREVLESLIQDMRDDIDKNLSDEDFYMVCEISKLCRKKLDKEKCSSKA